MLESTSPVSPTPQAPVPVPSAGVTTMGLSVLWIVEDDVSYHGLPVLLRHVPAVQKFVIRRSTDQADASGGETFDVCVGPPFCVVAAAAPAAIRGYRIHTVLALLREKDSASAWALAQQADGCLLERDLTVPGLRRVFNAFAGGPLRPGPPMMTTSSGSAAGPEPARKVPSVSLTSRERAVLSLLVRGQGNQQIASSLQMSIHGAKRHVSNLLIKFNCVNRTELALTAMERGIVD